MERASRVSLSSQGRGRKVLDTDWHTGRHQGLRGQSFFKELQEKEFEDRDVKPGYAAGKAGQSPSSSWGPGALPQGGSGPGGSATAARELCQRVSAMSCSSATNSHRKLFPGLFLAMGTSCFCFLTSRYNPI